MRPIRRRLMASASTSAAPAFQIPSFRSSEALLVPAPISSLSAVHESNETSCVERHSCHGTPRRETVFPSTQNTRSPRLHATCLPSLASRSLPKSRTIGAALASRLTMVTPNLRGSRPSALRSGALSTNSLMRAPEISPMKPSAGALIVHTVPACARTSCPAGDATVTDATSPAYTCASSSERHAARSLSRSFPMYLLTR